MKRIFYIIAFCSISSVVQASSNNPMLARVDTLTGEIEYNKSRAQLLETASKKSYTDSKIQTQINTQKNKEQTQQLSLQDQYNATILACNNNLGLTGTDKITLERRDLKAIGMALYQVLDNKREEDQAILGQLNTMYNSLENKYCFKKPSKSRIERERTALFTVVNRLLFQINEQNEMADDASSGNSSPICASAPAQAVVVDAKTGHYQEWM